ncbi:MAG TPA: PAS domain S-box protein, partial [Syntrophales bacterium]|nr:PAS domain S-box protein [Syntrophales bacterium]
TFISKDGTSFPGEVSSVIFRDHEGQLKTSMIIRDMSEKRKREQDYQLLFREMLNGFAVHEIICDTQGNPVDYRFLTVNPAFERITGLKAEHIVGRTVLEVFPDTERYWIETYGRVALTGEPTLFENYSKELDKYFEVTAFRSAPNQFACNFTDITERKRTEFELQANKAQLSNALEMAHLGHWEYDVGTDIFTFSDQFYKIFRTTTEQVGGYTMSADEYAERFVHPEDMHRVVEETRQAIETTDPHYNRQLEHRILYLDGTVGYITVRFFIVKDSNGRTVKTYGVNQDITERKRSEEALRESEKKFRTLTQNTPDIISRIDRQGRHIFINKAIEKVANHTVEDYLGKTNEELGMPEESLVLWNHQFRKAFETAKLVNFEFDFPSPDGIRNFFSTVVPEFDEEGRVSTLLILARDITDRKKSMVKLRKALEATVRAIAVTVETRDPYTAGHQRGVADLSRAIAMELELTSDRVDGIQMAALIHDLGKISVPAEILSKPTKLTEPEFGLIKTHSQSGYDILKDIDFPWPIARMILEHHERMDGSGYPRNLRGDDILLESRILAVADVVESMASHRPYRPAMGLNAAIEEIEKNRGTIYDADVVDACLRLIREKRFLFGWT